MKDKLIIFDTTLRGGEQSPGASMTRDEKLRMARQLERMRVDAIEAGFAAASNGDYDAVRAVGRFDVVEPGEAEVAFSVSDALRGLGLGCVVVHAQVALEPDNGVGHGACLVQSVTQLAPAAPAHGR